MKAGLDKAVFTENCFFDTKARGNSKVVTLETSGRESL